MTQVNHFGKRTEWSLIYSLIYACLNILAQLQILFISLYVPFSSYIHTYIFAFL
jgi:hypothetical protein